MDRFTLDVEAILVYAVGQLPDDADAACRDVTTGQAVAEAPAIAVAESVYMAEKTPDIAGKQLTRPAADIPDMVQTEIGARIVGLDYAQLKRMASLLADFPSQIHDAMIIASHEVQQTDAIVTSDEQIDDHAPTVW